MNNDRHYLQQCVEHGGGPRALEVWVELRRILTDRQVLGWRFEVINPDWRPEAAWCLGLEGASRLIVEPLIAVDGGEGIYVFDSDHDLERRFPSIEAFVSWLDEHEHAYEGLTNLQKRLLEDLLEINRERWSNEQGDDDGASSSDG